MARRILSVICCGLALLELTSCGAKPTRNILDDGMSKFAGGKEEENYYFKKSGALLDELIDKYSGSYYRPTGSSMTDDEHDDAKKSHGTGQSSAEPATVPGDTDPSAEPGDDDPAVGYDGVPEVSNMTELLRVFHDAYDATAEYAEFRTVNGFRFNTDTDLQYVYTTLQREDPIDASGVASWSTWQSGNEYYVSIVYSYDIDELKAMKAETITLVEDAVAEINAFGKSEYEIVYAVNEYLCDTVYYPPNEPYEPVTHTAYGALKNGCAVCEGYACAAKLILGSYGVECDIEVGECLKGGGHAWNLVKVDGDWYQLDVTWNDGSYDRDDYFLVTDDFMKKSRIWDESEYPVCAKAPYSA